MPSLALACRLSAVSRASRRPFSPASLFSSGEQGVWYDPSDMSTMFQDAAGTTPVTAVGQPVGLILDKSKGLVLGPELIAQPVNFNANWIATAGGTPGASGSSFTTSSIGGFWINVLTPGKTYQVTVNGSTTAASGVTLRQTDTTTTSQIRAGFGPAVFKAQSGFTHFYVRNESAGTTTVTSISVRELPGNHATQATVPKRPILKIDGNGKYYLLFDGVDDAMQTGNIDFTGTGKMTVFAGVRKLTDTASGVFVELSADSLTTAGAFVLLSPGSSGANSYRFFSRGSNAPASSPGNGVFAAAPDTSTITCISNISGPEQTLRRNAGLVESSTASQGTGNFGNYPLYIGSRVGILLPFNGHLYSLIVRGAQSSEAQILSAETYCNQKTGAY